MMSKFKLIAALLFAALFLIPPVSVKAEGCRGSVNCISTKDNYWIHCDGEKTGNNCVISEDQKQACCSPNPPPVQNPVPDLPAPPPFVPGDPIPPSSEIPPASDPNNSSSAAPISNNQNPLVNWSRSDVPKEIHERNDSDKNLLGKMGGLFAGIGSLFRSVVLKQPIVYTSAKNSQQVTVPQEVQPTPKAGLDGLTERFKGFFIGPGLFNNTPFNSENAPDDTERLKASERSWFPEEIKPLTGPAPTPTGTTGTGTTK